MWPSRRRCADLARPQPTADDSGGAPVTTAETVPLDAIVGTIARCCDFDRCFRPLRPHLRRRLDALRSALDGRPLPAVRLHQVDGDLYVVDGHHRVALARERGMVAVDAIVTCRC